MDDIYISYHESEFHIILTIEEIEFKENIIKSISPFLKNNDIKILPIILGYLKNKCNHCKYLVSNTISHNGYGELCFTCYDHIIKRRIIFNIH